MFDQTIRFVSGKSAESFCDECYFVGFLENLPEEWHLCKDCRADLTLPTVPVSFETWKSVTWRETYHEYTFEQFLADVRRQRETFLLQNPEIRQEREQFRISWQNGLREIILAQCRPISSVE